MKYHSALAHHGNHRYPPPARDDRSAIERPHRLPADRHLHPDDRADKRGLLDEVAARADAAPGWSNAEALGDALRAALEPPHKTPMPAKG
jgi:hypothetical protein